jgi:hypothetical protein
LAEAAARNDKKCEAEFAHCPSPPIIAEESGALADGSAFCVLEPRAVLGIWSLGTAYLDPL